MNLYFFEGGGVHQLSWPGFLLLVEASKHSREIVKATSHVFLGVKNLKAKIEYIWRIPTILQIILTYIFFFFKIQQMFTFPVFGPKITFSQLCLQGIKSPYSSDPQSRSWNWISQDCSLCCSSSGAFGEPEHQRDPLRICK